MCCLGASQNMFFPCHLRLRNSRVKAARHHTAKGEERTDYQDLEVLPGSQGGE